MDKNTDYNFNSFYGNNGYSPYENFDPFQVDNTFNPISQYEQAYMYYKYLTQAIEYKIKCKEYEKLNGRDQRSG